jgi:hypothetical protein
LVENVKRKKPKTLYWFPFLKYPQKDSKVIPNSLILNIVVLVQVSWPPNTEIVALFY